MTPLLLSPKKTASWICGLMRENSESVGFIPEPTIQGQYLGKNRVIFQMDSRGRQVGYLLHGAIYPARPVHITQTAIIHEKRLLSFGTQAIAELARRAITVNASSIRLRCAEDLEALFFWQKNGFQIERIDAPNNRRNRRIYVMSRPLALPLFDHAEQEKPSCRILTLQHDAIAEGEQAGETATR